MNLIEAYANLDNATKKQRLDEKIPRDLANAMKNPRGGDNPSAYEINARRRGYSQFARYPDFENNEYNEITPEEAIKLKKQGKADKVKALVNGEFVDFYSDGSTNSRSTYVRNSYGTLVKNADKLYFVDDSKANAKEKRAQRDKDNSLTYYGPEYSYGYNAVRKGEIDRDTGEHMSMDGYDKRRVSRHQKNVDEFTQQLSDLEKAWEDGDVSRNEYNRKKADLQSSIDSYKKEIDDIKERNRNARYDNRYDTDAKRMQSQLTRFKDIKRNPAEQDVERSKRDVANAEKAYNEKIKEKERNIASLQKEIDKLKSAGPQSDWSYRYETDNLKKAEAKLAQQKKDLADMKAGKWSVDDMTNESLKRINKRLLKEADEHDQYYARKKQRIEEFAHQIPFDGLFDYIKDLTGINDLSFDIEFKKDRWGTIYPMFHSQNLADRVGFLNLIFKTIEISSFNSEVSADEPGWSNRDYSQDYQLSYWCTVSFRYTHPSGGSNGVTFMTAWYDEQNGWQFRVNE